MQITHSIEIDRAPEDVWPWLREPDRQKQWMKGLLANEVVSGDGHGVGTRFRMKIKEGGRVAEYDGEVTRSQHPTHLGIRLSGGAFKDGHADVDYRLSDLAGRTRLDYVCQATCGGWAVKAFGWLFKGFATMQLKGFLKSLKRLAEQEA